MEAGGRAAYSKSLIRYETMDGGASALVVGLVKQRLSVFEVVRHHGINAFTVATPTKQGSPFATPETVTVA
jgi:hypothetical protein